MAHALEITPAPHIRRARFFAARRRRRRVWRELLYWGPVSATLVYFAQAMFPPGTRALEEQFHAHAGALRAVADRLSGEEDAAWMDLDGRRSGVSAESAAVCLPLMREAGVTQMDKRGRRIVFRVWSSLDSRNANGIGFDPGGSGTETVSLVGALDAPGADCCNVAPVSAPLGGGWFIWARQYGGG